MDSWQKSCTMHRSEWKIQAEHFKFIVNTYVQKDCELKCHSSPPSALKQKKTMIYSTSDYKHHNCKHKTLHHQYTWGREQFMMHLFSKHLHYIGSV